MPYDKVSDLPDSVKENLSEHAQQIYLAAFNKAWDKYSDPGQRSGDDSREETSHKVAWNAVKEKVKHHRRRRVARRSEFLIDSYLIQ